MRALGIIALCVLVPIVGLVVGYKIMFPTYSYRYRLTVAIEIDGQVHSGSSVIEVVWRGAPEFGDVGPYHPGIRGQAAFVDLGEHRAVVAVLTARAQGGIVRWPEGVDALWLVPQAFGKGLSLEEFPQLSGLRGRRELAPDNMPRLIWFSDIADPKTARRIDPVSIPTLFGPGARLAAAYVEITRDPIITDIDKKLPWFEMLRSGPNHGVMYLPSGFALAWTMFIGDSS